MSMQGKHIVFIAGEPEYRSEVSLPALAEAAARDFGARTTVLQSHPDPEFPSDIPGLDALDGADLAVFYMRFRTLPEEQVAAIERYLRRGGPVVGFRTSTHAFRYPEGHPLVHWNQFGAKVLGAPWIKHFGHASSTDVSVHPGAEGNELLKGVAPEFHVRSWLYHVVPEYPPAEAVRLLDGKSVGPGDGDPAARPINPVAWTYRHAGGGRVFTTTMGHPDDFHLAPFQRLVANGLHWALGLPVPG